MTRPAPRCFDCNQPFRRAWICPGCGPRAPVKHACEACHLHTKPAISAHRRTPATTRPPGQEPWMGPSWLK